MPARYDAVADTYASGVDDVSNPAASELLDLVGPVAGRRVLDIACGHGVIARTLARRGAEVVGVDLSTALLERARAIESTEPLGIGYVEGDVADPGLLAGERFDVATCNFGLSDIDDLDAALASVARLLEPSGRFVASILHPCFAGAGDVSGSWPTGSSYDDERRWRAEGERSTLRQVVGANHRMLSTYVGALVGNGLAIDELREPRPEPSWAADRPLAATLPVYLVVGCTRRAHGDPGG